MAASPLPFLTRAWLEKHTIPQSLERGIDYYQKGKIISVILRKEVIEGKVKGTTKYVQTIGVDESGEPVATCSCPYNSSGYCKHIVAVSMAAIDGHVEKIEGDAARNKIQINDRDFYLQHFLDSPAGFQEAFLMQAFSRKPEWREAFLSFQEPPSEQHLVDIREVRERIRDSLLEMIISPQEVEEHTGKNGQASEVAENFLRRKLFTLFKTHVDHLKRRLALGDLLNAHRIWIAMYEAISGLEQPAHSDVILPDEYPSYLKWEWSQASVVILAAVSREIMGPGLVRQLVTLFSDRWSYYQSGADTRKPAISIDAIDFEPWLILMAADPLSGTFVKHRKDAYSWKLDRLEEVLSKI